MTKSKNGVLVFSISGFDGLADKVATCGGWSLGEIKQEMFDYGNFTLRRDTDVAAKDVLLIGGSVSPSALNEILRKAAFLVQQGAHSLTIYNPYMANCRLEREGREGEDVAAKWEAEQFDRLPSPSVQTKLFIADMHAPTVAYYFDRAKIHVRESWLQDVTFPAIKTIGGEDFILGGADSGSLKWTLAWAQQLGVDWVTNLKTRDHFAPRGISLAGTNPAGKRVVLFDDILQSGSSAIIAAKTFLEHGAKEVFAVFSHTVGTSLEQLKKSGVIKRIVTTDSHPQALTLAEQNGDFLKVETIASVVTTCVKRAWDW